MKVYSKYTLPPSATHGGKTGVHKGFFGFRHARHRNVRVPVQQSQISSTTSDEHAEESRSLHFGRAVFTHRDWKSHKSASRYLRHVKTLPGSRIFKALRQPLSAVIAVAGLETAYEACREVEWFYRFPLYKTKVSVRDLGLPSQAGLLPHWCFKLSVLPFDVFNLTSFALSLLLVFRTNASYDRWLEARGIWGGVVITTRNITRACLPKIREENLKRMLLRWVTAFPYTLKSHLVEGTDIREELQGLLLEGELKTLLEATHRPNFVIGMVDEIVSASSLSSGDLQAVEDNLSSFSAAVGVCERIFKTPIPVSWTRHTSRFLVLWLAFLPTSLYPTAGYATALATAAIASLLLGIDEIGVQIEEPFEILPLDHFCQIVHSSIAEMYDTQAARRAAVQRCLRDGNSEPPTSGDIV